MLVAFFVTRNIMVSSGTIGLYHDWPVGPFPELNAKYSFDGLQLYDLTIGNKIYPSDWMFRILLVPFAFFGGEIISKGLLLFFITLSGFSMFYFGRTIKLSYLSSLLAGLIFLFSPIIFTRAIAGHIYYLLGYSLAPLLLVAFIKAQKDVKNRLKFSIVAGFIFAIMGTQIQFFVMGFLILLPLILFDLKKLKSNSVILMLTLTIGFLMHLPWILPLMLTTVSASISTQFFLAYHEIISSPTLLESIRVIGYATQPYSYTQLVTQGIMPQWLFYTNFLMPIMAFFVLMVKRNKYTIGFSAIAILGIFLSKGINPPFENIFILAFQYTPLIIFREIWHIAFLVFFSYTILISIFFDEVTKKIGKRSNQFKSFVLALILIIIVSNGYPLLLGNFAGYMQTYSFDEDYKSLVQSFQNDENPYRLLWLPSLAPIKYDSKTLAGVDPLISYSSKPTFPQHINPSNPFSRLVMFLTSTIHENKTQQFGNLISPYATEYVISRNDFETQYPFYVPLGLYPELTEMWKTNVEKDFVAIQNDLKLENETANFSLYQNTNPANFVYSPTTIIYGTKDLSTLNQLAKVTNLTNIAYLTDLTALETDTPIFIVKDGSDLTSIITGTKIDPGNYATEIDAKIGWINSKNWFWYNYLFASTINNGAFSKTQSQLEISFETNAVSEIWVKTLKWENGGIMTFRLNDEQAENITTFSPAFNLEWIKLYDEVSPQLNTLTFSNIDGENYVDEILLITKDQINKATSVLQESSIIYLIEPNSLKQTNYLQTSPKDSEYTLPISSQYWSDPAAGFSAVVENEAVQGTSFRVTTDINSASWSWIRSLEVPVNTGEKYLVMTSLKQENAKSSHVVVEGFNVTSDEWVQLVQVPSGQDGSFDWKSFEAVLAVDENISKLRVALNAGWVLDEANGNATSWFGQVSITPQQDSNELILEPNTSAEKNLIVLKEGTYKISAEVLGNIQLKISDQTFTINSDKYELVEIGSVLLSNGSQHLEIEALSEAHIRSIWVHTGPQDKSLEDILISRVEKVDILEYKQENPAYWQVKVNASSPFLLVFAAPYDQNWLAQTSNEIYNSIPTYGYVNGFYINQTGLLEITLEYEPQKLFNYGLTISLLTLTTCIAYLTITYAKNNQLLQTIKKLLIKK